MPALVRRVERIDRERPTKTLHPRAHPGQPRPLRAGPGTNAVVSHGDDELLAQARTLHPHNDLHTFGMSMTDHIAQPLLNDSQDRHSRGRGQPRRQIQFETGLQPMLALDAHEASQRLGEIAVLERTRTLAGDERPGLVEIVTGDRLQLSQTTVDRPGLAVVELTEMPISTLGKAV